MYVSDFVKFCSSLSYRKLLSDLFSHYKFTAAGGASTAPEKAVKSKGAETGTLLSPGIEDLFKDSPLEVKQDPEKPKKDVKNDIMSLFEKVSDVTCQKEVFTHISVLF